jgi:hypothetical protein
MEDAKCISLIQGVIYDLKKNNIRQYKFDVSLTCMYSRRLCIIVIQSTARTL